MSVFPLNIVEKTDTPERLLALQHVEEKYKILATDINVIVAAVKELHGRGSYIEDINGKKWWTRKGFDNKDMTVFENMDKVEGFTDDTNTVWVEGIIIADNVVLPNNIDDPTKFFITNKKIKAD